MPCGAQTYADNSAQLAALRGALHAHWIARGVPASKWSALEYRWLATKGWRHPGVAYAR